jgi:hypothetical protein
MVTKKTCSIARLNYIDIYFKYNSEHNQENLWDHLEKKRKIFALWGLTTFASLRRFSKFEQTNLQLLTGWDDSWCDPTAIIFYRIRSAHNRATNLTTNVQPINEREEPAASCRWTGWVWEKIGWNSKTSDNVLIILEESTKYTSNQSRRTGRCQHVTNWTWKH